MAQTSDESPEESLVFYGHKRTDIYFPIRSSQRVKYTSFDASHTYIAFGSSSGGVYLFRKGPNNAYDYLFTILNADNCGPITCVAFADNDDHLIAMATSRGHLIIAEIEPQKQVLYKCAWNIIYQCSNFTKHSINIIKWDQYYDYRLYLSDQSGQIFILHNVKDMKNLMVLPMPSIILKINGKVYQMEIYMGLVLLSTQSKYVLYDLSSGELTQIGKKSVRTDGQYGVCFYPRFVSPMAGSVDNHIYNCIFCCRPKSRLWECDLKGSVRFTHQFKELLINQMPQKIINGDDICFLNQCTDSTNANGNCVPALAELPSAAAQTALTALTGQTPTFAKLCVMNTECFECSFIVTFTNGPNPCLYIINPINACIVSYCILNVSHIEDMYCIDSDIYITYNSKADKRLGFCKISLLSLEQCLQLLTEVNNEFRSAANLVINHFEYFSSNQNKTNSRFRTTDKLLEKLWSNLKSDEKQEFRAIEQLVIKRNDDNILSDESQEIFLNSIDSNTSDIYSRHTNELYYDMTSQYSESAIDMVDIGFSELKKLKEIVFSKLNSNQIDFKTNFEPLLSTEDSDRKQLTLNNSNNCLEENNKINLIANKTKDNKQNDLKFILDSLESELNSSQSVHKYRCDCESPLPGSHLNQNEIQRKIKRFLNENMDFMEYSVIDLIAISKRNAIWPLYMQLMLKCEEYDKYLKFSLMLNDVKLLLNENIQNYLFSTENFERLLKLFAEQRDVGSDQIIRCIECNKSLSDIEDGIKWETIIKFCIKSIGIESAIGLLKKFIDKNPFFSTEFYLLLLRMRMICVYQSPVTREKLNNLMIHLNALSKVKSSDNHSSASVSTITSSSMTSVNSQNQSKGFKINIIEEKCAKYALIESNFKSAKGKKA